MACARTCAPLWSRYSRMNDYLPTYLLVFCPCSLHNMYSITLLSCCIQLFGRDRVLSESLNKSLYQSVLWRCILYTACLIHDALLLHVCLCGILQNRVLICASFQKKCVLMEISLDKANKIKWVKNNITRGVVCACLGCSSLFLPSSSRCPLSLFLSSSAPRNWPLLEVRSWARKTCLSTRAALCPPRPRKGTTLLSRGVRMVMCMCGRSMVVAVGGNGRWRSWGSSSTIRDRSRPSDRTPPDPG